MRFQRTVALIVGIALVLGAVGVGALAVLGGGSGATDLTNVPTSTPDAEAIAPPDPELARFYGQRLAWDGCGEGVLCAWLEVPLDYRRPRDATIDLLVLKVPAQDPDARIGSLVVNPGGPGASGVEYAANADLVFRQPVRDAYDVVGFDPRGVGQSEPVDCLSDEELDGYIAADPDPDTDAEVDDLARWSDTLGMWCPALSGTLARHVTTIEAARDVDVLRSALGESTLDYFGASYGTKLGATYAELFPDRVGRFVLDGGVDLSMDGRELSLEQAGGFESALRAYVQDCADDHGCPLGDDLDEGLATVRQLLDDVDAQPLPTSLDDRQLEIGNAFYGVVAPLYGDENWPLLTDALSAALDGDGTGLLELSDFYHSRSEDGYADNGTEANYAISCLDDPSAIPVSEVPDQIPEFEAASPTFGATFAWGLASCDGMRIESTEPLLEIDASGAAPIVVVGTTRDPATPYDWAVSLADQLESGVLVSRDGDGHTGYNSGNDCVDAAVEDYLVEGVVPDDGLSC